MDLPVILVAFAGLFGLVVGSFLNVVIVRRGELDWRDRRSLDGRSACPACGRTLHWYENVPVVSWLALRGRCAGCGKPISWRYPLVELLTGVLWAAVATTADDVPTLVSGLCLVTVLVPVTFIDLQLRIIPDEVNYTATFLGFACSLGLGPQDRFLAGAEWWWLEVLASAFAAAAFLMVPAMLTRGGGMGLGDGKLALALGAFLGATVSVAIIASLFVAMLPSIWLLATRGLRRGRKSAIPFGPFLAIGGVIAWFAGPELLSSYLASTGI